MFIFNKPHFDFAVHKLTDELIVVSLKLTYESVGEHVIEGFLDSIWQSRDCYVGTLFCLESYNWPVHFLSCAGRRAEALPRCG